MNKTTKRALALGASAAVLAGTGVAYAYWSTTGTGSGSASTTTSNVHISFSQTAAQQALALYPGQAAQPIAGTVKNDSTDQNGYVGTVTASIASVTKAVTAPAGTCDATDYTLGGSPVPVNTDLAPLGTASFGGQTIQFNNKSASNQDACQGATVTLAFSSN